MIGVNSVLDESLTGGPRSPARTAKADAEATALVADAVNAEALIAEARRRGRRTRLTRSAAVASSLLVATVGVVAALHDTSRPDGCMK